MSEQTAREMREDATYEAGRTRRFQDALEALVDQASLANVLEALDIICHEKAEHIRANWQDDATARAWERAAKVIDRAANHPAVVGVR